MSTQVHHTLCHYFNDIPTNRFVICGYSKMRVLTLPLVHHNSEKKSVIGEGRYDVKRVEETPEPLQSNRCDGVPLSSVYGCFASGLERKYWGLDKQECDQMNIRQLTTTQNTKKVRDDSVLRSSSNSSLSSSSTSSGDEKVGTRRTRLGSSSTSSSSSGPSSPLSSPKRGTGGSYGSPTPPLPSLPQRRKQKQLCYGWLSPCINYTECPFAHSLDELLGDFYTEETMQAVETFYATQTQPYYQQQQQQRARLDRKRFIYLKRELSTCACEAINCPMRGNDHMKNKIIQVLTDPSRPVIHYCTVACKMCTNVMRAFLPIYTLAPMPMTTTATVI